jgi:hypothetical protein
MFVIANKTFAKIAREINENVKNYRKGKTSQQHVKQMDYFWENILMSMTWDFGKNICFCEIMCKAEADAPGSAKKFAIYQQIYGNENFNKKRYLVNSER